MRRLTIVMLSLAPISLASISPAPAQTPAQALASMWNTICSTSINGTQLHQRCGETLGSPAPDANLMAAIGQHLEEIPGQARIATRDQQPTSNLPGRGNSQPSNQPWQLQANGRLHLDLDNRLAANWALFFSADIGHITRKAGPNEAAFSADAWSMTGGADWRPADGWQLGLALSRSHEKLDYSATDSLADTEFTGPLLLTSRELGTAWLVHGYAGQLTGDYRLSRDISFRIPQASGETIVKTQALGTPDARRQLAGLAINQTWSTQAWSGSSELGWDWTRTRIDAFSERGGAGLALDLPERNVSTRRGRFDLQLNRTGSFSQGVWQGSAGVGWRREFGNGRRPLTLTLSEDSRDNPIRFDTEDPDRNWGEFSLAGSLTVTGGHAVFFNLSQRFAHRFMNERMISAGFRFELP